MERNEVMARFGSMGNDLVSRSARIEQQESPTNQMVKLRRRLRQMQGGESA